MLKELRKKRGLTFQALSDLSGIPLKTLQRYEAGTCKLENMTLINAVKLADALGVHPRELLKGD